MSSIGSPSPFLFGKETSLSVKRSLRFNPGDSPNLARTFGTSTNIRKRTLSVWVKRSKINDSLGQVFFEYFSSGSGGSMLFAGAGTGIGNNDEIHISNRNATSGSGDYYLVTDGFFRDPSAWYHIVLQYDTTQSTASDRIKLYVNGNLASFSSASYPSQNYDSTAFLAGTATNHNIGYGFATGSANYFGGYLAELNFIDGEALTPASFGETNAVTGQWNPIEYTGSYGNQGFYLNFSDNSGTTATTLGKDSSGNDNNFTPSNFSVAAGAGNDSVEDTPTNNFPTFNPLVQNVNTFSEGNLQVTMTSNAPPSFYSTMGVSSGKYYMEFLVKSNNNYPLGISGSTQSSNYFSLGDQIGFWLASTSTRVFRNGSNITSNSVVVGNFETGVEGTSTSWAVDDIAGLALDMDNKIVYLYKGSTQVGYVNFSTFNYDTVFFGGGNYINGNVYIGNFGQRPFTHTPPTGYKALCSANLPDPTILLPNKHFDTTLYTGSNSSQEISTLNFQPDWLWFKNRGGTNWHALIDSVRGRAAGLASNKTNSEYTSSASQDLVSFDNDGFSVGSNAVWGSINGSGANIVAWGWDAGETDNKTYTVTVVNDGGNKFRFDGFGTSSVTLSLAKGGTYTFNYPSGHPLRFSTTSDGTHGGGSEYTSGVSSYGNSITITVAANAPTLYYYCSNHSGMGGQVNPTTTLGSSNFDGSLQSIVKVNPTAGFSIIKYTGNGSNGATVGHGLGVKPDFILIKKRDNNSGGNTGNWIAQHKSLTNGVNATSALFTLTSYSNAAIYLNGNFNQSSYVFDNQVNGNTDTFVAYCFSEVAGYSKFGSYTGNGSSDGAFVFLGFRAAFIMIKSSSLETNWNIVTADIDGYNVVTKYLDANTFNAEGSYTFLDILSNGFKARNTGNSFNQSGASYIYLAFAEAPFKNARAR